MAWWLLTLIIGAAILVVGLVLLAIYDLTQTKQAILRNYPVVGHLRQVIESSGPKLRQYIVAGNDEERPFSRDQRRWVYATATKENSYFGFGTDSTIDRDGHIIIKHSAFPDTDPIDELAELPCAKVLGDWRDRPHKFRPPSIINVSAMSFGSLSAPAIEALNKGCKIAGAMHNTGEGGISDHHRHGGDLMFQFGTGYFGCRHPDGTFSLDALVDSVNSAKVRCIEVKLSQGAKPGLGGVLPGAKVTAEIAAARGVEIGKTVYSPNAHSAFSTVDGLIDFVESIADATGLPVGIKSAVGQMDFWQELATRMAARQQGPDFITIDGGEGGTGAGPLVFTDHVAMPFRLGFARVYQTFVDANLHQQVVFIGSGKLGFGAEAMLSIALGADLIGVAREAMLAIGCIQAQECHTGHCPTGVATQNKRLIRGLDPTDKSARLANYLIGVRTDLLKLAHACGAAHPALVPPEAVEIVEDAYNASPAQERFGYPAVVDERLSLAQREELSAI